MFRTDAKSLRRGACAGRWLACLLFVGLVACGDDDNNGGSGDADVDAEVEERDSGDEPREDSGDPEPDASDEPEPDASHDAGDEPEPDASEPDPEPDAGVDAGEPIVFGGLTVTVDPEDHELDLFGTPGHRFWFEVSEEQMEKVNNDGGGGYPCPECGGDIYTPGGSNSNATYADHLVVENAETGEAADYGKVEIALVGESTRRAWDPNTIPNVRVDANEFEKDTRIGTYEHLRLNNSLVGSIFKEAMAHRIYRALDYPALRSSHAFMSAPVWGEHVWVPMTLMEMYKRRFCRDNQDTIGGSCENMWEFPGDLGGGYYPYPGGGFPGGGGGQQEVPADWCQVSECDNTRLVETMAALAEAPRGEGFKEALDPFISWDHFHQFQCLSWILWTGDDPLHNTNNNLIIERDTDHKLVWAPYSVDIHASFPEWGYVNTPLTGQNVVALGCQSDPTCWEDTIATCEDLIVRFDDLNPEEMVDELVTTLTDLNMMRYGDDERAETLREWYAWRQTVLADELEQYRYLPDEYGNCPNDLIRCGDGGCGTEEACEDRQCEAGYTMCEAAGRCLDRYEHCPECTETSPFYCHVLQSCVLDAQACADACDYEWGGQYVWCEQLNQCVEYYYCEVSEDDAGVIGFAGNGGFGGIGGGIGGFAGFGMGGFPGGGVAGAGAAGDGVVIEPLPAP
jgi:hypothetical protein